MEFDILNELLDQTVFQIFEGCREQRPTIIQVNKQKSPFAIQEVQQEKKETEPKNPIQWSKDEGTRKLQESMKKLKLDNQSVQGKHLNTMSLETIFAEKKAVKNELKQYDMAFRQIFQRLPNRQEKEPMRLLYVYYKKIKSVISKKDQRSQEGLEEMKGQLQKLKQKKADLRVTLHQFQQEFSKTHNRKIRFHKDIAPVEEHYKLYKEIKQEIQRLEALCKQQK